MSSYKELSKRNWRNTQSPEMPTNEEIKIGSLQRIADATELMAGKYIKIQNDLDMYQRWYNQEAERVRKRDKTIAGLRGQITKLKKKL